METLHSLATIAFTGADSKSFLQGQLSHDLNLLSPKRPLLASCNSAQGRVQAVMTLIERHDGIVAILPSDMIDLLVARLRKYILRSKVVIANASATLQCRMATQAELYAARLPVPAAAGEHDQDQTISVMHWWDQQVERFLVLQAPSATETIANDHAVDEQWLLADIRAGLPQVLPATHEMFVAQMLNLDAVNGISFNKGCYTGQEIIARAHFRGAVKRRMFHLQASCPPTPPATRILLQHDQSHAGDVVMAAPTATGCEMLAVLNLAALNFNGQDAALCLDSNHAALLKILPLPYALPIAT